MATPKLVIKPVPGTRDYREPRTGVTLTRHPHGGWKILAPTPHGLKQRDQYGHHFNDARRNAKTIAAEILAERDAAHTDALRDDKQRFLDYARTLPNACQDETVDGCPTHRHAAPAHTTWGQAQWAPDVPIPGTPEADDAAPQTGGLPWAADAAVARGELTPELAAGYGPDSEPKATVRLVPLAGRANLGIVDADGNQLRSGDIVQIDGRDGFWAPYDPVGDDDMTVYQIGVTEPLVTVARNLTHKVVWSGEKLVRHGTPRRDVRPHRHGLGPDCNGTECAEGAPLVTNR